MAARPMPPADTLNFVPLRWPSAWKDAGPLELLRNTRINCLIFDDPAAAAAVRGPAAEAKLEIALWSEAAASGIAAAPLSEMKWDSAAPVLAIADATWPGIRIEDKAGGVHGGPTGAPWVDANGWAVQVARAAAPEKTIWLASTPPERTFALRPRSYVLPIADAAAHGAKWIIALDDGMARSLASRGPAALAVWSEMMRAVDFFESHREWRDLPSAAALGAISDFSGPNEFLAAEFLNLAARRNLLCRALLKTRPLDFYGLTSIIYLDEQAPPAQLRDQLLRFVQRGGLLISRFAIAVGAPLRCDIPGYRMSAVGKGRAATATSGWDDPWALATDAQVLTSRRDDPVRLYNPGGVGLNVQGTAARQIVHLVNYSLARAGDRKSLAPRDHFESARFYTFDQSPVALTFARRPKVSDEIALPPFSVYGAVELRK
jgi:hypothetical protein